MQTSPARFKVATLLVLAASAALPAAALAASSGPTSTVVYVGGNDLVIKASDGSILNYMVPAGYKFTAGETHPTVSELKPGEKLTAPVATGVDPQVVSAVQVMKAKVYGTTPPDTVTLTTTEGAKDFTVPAGTMFMVDGTPTSLANLKSDAEVEVTVVTPAADGAAGAPPATPPMAGALLITKTDELPSAGTNLPLYGILGFTMLLLGFAVLRFRKSAAVA